MKIPDKNLIQKTMPIELMALFSDQVCSILSCKNPYSRVNQIGHITASALVIRDGKVLLIFHPYIKRWFQPGGHIDGGEHPIDAAIREVYEETGYICEPESENQDPIDVDIHEIPKNSQKGEGSHFHIDLLYCLRVLRHEQSIEDIKYKWFVFGDIENIRVQRALSKLR